MWKILKFIFVSIFYSNPNVEISVKKILCNITIFLDSAQSLLLESTHHNKQKNNPLNLPLIW